MTLETSIKKKVNGAYKKLSKGEKESIRDMSVLQSKTKGVWKKHRILGEYEDLDLI